MKHYTSQGNEQLKRSVFILAAVENWQKWCGRDTVWWSVPDMSLVCVLNDVAERLVIEWFAAWVRYHIKWSPRYTGVHEDN